MKLTIIPLLLAAGFTAPEPVDPFEIDRKGYLLPRLEYGAEKKIKAVIPEKPPAKPGARRRLLVIWELGFIARPVPTAP